MNTQLRQRFAASKLEIADRVVAFSRRWIIGRADNCYGDEKEC